LKKLFALIVSIAAASVSMSGAETKYAQCNNTFAFALYGRLAENSKGNIFFSPYSISSALAMTYNGAKGATAIQMSQTLHFDTDTVRLNKEIQEINSSLSANANKEYELDIANALWGQKDYVFLAHFLENMRQYFEAALNKVDFINDTEGARRTINSWISSKTAGKIHELIGPRILNELTRLVLTNAVYFKGSWSLPFKERFTNESDFYVNDIKVTKARLMFEGGKEFGYCKTEGIQAVSLAYRGGNLAMLVALPEQKQDLDAMEKKITAGLFSRLISELKQQSVQVYLPRFKSSSEFELAGMLSDMGMPDAFSGAADFSAMTGNTELCISNVIHQAVVEVNEKGTEAAAATAVVMALKSVKMTHNPQVIFKADHPFIYFIYDTRTGIIIFMGRMMEPNK